MRHLILLSLLACNGKEPADLAPKGEDPEESDPPVVETDLPVDTEVIDSEVIDTDLPVDWEELPPVPGLSASALDAIGEEIDDVLAQTSASAGILVVDVDSGQVVYAHEPDLPLKPASNTKLFTTAALLGLLGEDERSSVRAYGGQPIDGNGRVGTLHVVAHHDWTWSTFFHDYPEWPADRLAEALWEAGVADVGTLRLTGEVLFEGYQFDYYDADLHRDAAAAAMESALIFQGIGVDDVVVDEVFDVPGGAVLLAVQDGLPFSVATHPVNDISHNEMADIGSRHLGERLAGESSYEAGAAQVLDWLDDVGVGVTGLELYDGSGLSHDNRVTARSIVELQTAMLEHPAGAFWRATHSVAGRSGTLASRMTGGDTAGRFWGKSGTLTGVIATSGLLHHAHDGHRYLIAQLMNGVGSSTTARSQQDEIVRIIARDWREDGERPEEPVLRVARPDGAGRIWLDWDPVGGAEGYEVWLTDEPRVWRRQDAVWARDVDELQVSGLAGRTWYVRVVARNLQGVSEPSDTYAVSAGAGPADVLIVDGIDRYATQWENRLGNGHGFVVDVAEAVVGRTVATAANEAVIDEEIGLEAHEALVWLLAEESTDDETFDAQEQQLVEAYLDQGGGLLVSGSEIGWDLDYLGTADDQGFFYEALGATYAGDDAGSYTVRPVPGGLLDGVGDLGFYRPGWLDVAYPEQLEPAGSGQALLSYVGGSGGTAAVAQVGPGRTVVLGFPLEALDDRASREAVLTRLLTFLTP
jgi:D-alanyl-D-alanine carboxypeptidase